KKERLALAEERDALIARETVILERHTKEKQDLEGSLRELINQLEEQTQAYRSLRLEKQQLLSQLEKAQSQLDRMQANDEMLESFRMRYAEEQARFEELTTDQQNQWES